MIARILKEKRRGQHRMNLQDMARQKDSEYMECRHRIRAWSTEETERDAWSPGKNKTTQDSPFEHVNMSEPENMCSVTNC